MMMMMSTTTRTQTAPKTLTSTASTTSRRVRLCPVASRFVSLPLTVALVLLALAPALATSVVRATGRQSSTGYEGPTLSACSMMNKTCPFDGECVDTIELVRGEKVPCEMNPCTCYGRASNCASSVDCVNGLQRCADVFYGAERARVCVACDADLDDPSLGPEHELPDGEDGEDDDAGADEEFFDFGGTAVELNADSCGEAHYTQPPTPPPSSCPLPSYETPSASASFVTTPSAAASASASPSSVTVSPRASSEIVVPSASPTSSVSSSNETESTICIAVEHLSGLKPHELVFAQHRRAAVLCDAWDNCATPGHMVSVRDHGAMMMRTYCTTPMAQGGCKKVIRWVNSPTMKGASSPASLTGRRSRRQVRIKSNAAHLEFTALAARYETRAEEAILSVAARVF